uniref:Biogenesis of lysosome-related organelles complex 1 subunit 5 n=1 Tax=Tetraodon nigroviridis TaxID=99883 RepID=H3CJH6_TETNG
MDKIAQADVGDIQSRLLDHRPVVNAEIRYFVKEFEEKRGHRESRLLGNINKMLLETSEQMQLPNIEAMAQQLSEIQLCICLIPNTQFKKNGKRIRYKHLDSQQSHQLQETMCHLKDEWNEFLKEQQRLKMEVDDEHNEAVRQLTTKYCEMEKELMKSYSL